MQQRNEAGNLAEGLAHSVPQSLRSQREARCRRSLADTFLAW